VPHGPIRARSLPALNRLVVDCRACPRLVAHRERVAREKKREFWDSEYWGRPVASFGDPNGRLLIVGLAPAAHGANRTGRMFTGDSSGSWLYDALHRFGFANQPNSLSLSDGLELSDCYITAAARCAPPANRPTQAELDACQPYLEREVRMLRTVRVTLALGHVGHRQWLRAAGWWDRLAPRQRPVFGHAASATLPDGMVLISSYHPSRQNTNTGRLTRKMWYHVFQSIRRLLLPVALLVAWMAPNARGQVAIDPDNMRPAAWERIATQVVNLTEDTILGVTVEVPDVIMILGVDAPTGWSYAQRVGSDTSAQAVSWTGGRIARGDTRSFALLGRLKADVRRNTLVFPVNLTYSSGETARWGDPRGEERPAPVINIVGTTTLSASGSLALAALAIAIASVALALSLARRTNTTQPR
jgi:uracil-DNA glycosylase